MSIESYADAKDGYFKKIQRNDRWAKWIIIIGGIGIIGIVVGMLAIIASVAMPLFGKSTVESLTRFELPGNLQPFAIGVDEYKETGYFIAPDGAVTFFSLPDGVVTDKVDVAAPGGGDIPLKEVKQTGFFRHTYLWGNGTAALVSVNFYPEFAVDGLRTIKHAVKTLATWESDGTVPLMSHCVKGTEVDLRVDLLEGKRMRIARVTEVENPITEVVTRSMSEGTFDAALNGKITALTVNAGGTELFAATDKAQLGRWNIRNAKKVELLDRVDAYDDARRITDISLLLGEKSLAVADEKGSLETWMAVRKSADAGRKTLSRIHTLKSHEGAIASIVPSVRNKTVLSVDEKGKIHGDFLTSERALYEFMSEGPVVCMSMNKRGNAFVFANTKGAVEVWSVHAPHPETSWKTLFGKVHYESYDTPEHVWQSSSASDDFEPKLSMLPLIHGTLKGTLYAMLFAAPLAILAALYTSQFMRPALRVKVKPAIEIMAAVPSVVIGFLAGLWLAPLLEDRMVGVFSVIMLLPAMIFLAFLFYNKLGHVGPLSRLPDGKEFLGLSPFLLFGVVVAMAVGGAVESSVFDGNFRQYLYDAFSLRVDQRNCIVIALALGFAVIPVIFTLADDALSAVPKYLTAASLALGASRWQTAWKVVLPSASPGIFAALMIGLGRAVGETMIVLMATGNTPIMEWNIFNGMRTLSANIAVEIPEAPHNETLYRTLFLSAVILFVFTFVVNTAAEMVRIRLREKYGNY